MRAALNLVATFSVALAIIPGVTPKSFEYNDPVPVKTVQLSSVTTLIPYDYYALPFCPPVDPSSEKQDLGSLLLGVVEKTLPYDLKMKVDVKCATLCEINYTKHDIAKFLELARKKYRASWTIDGLPVLYNYDGKFVRTSFPFGFVQNEERDTFGLFNHVNFLIKYHPVSRTYADLIFGDVFTTATTPEPRSNNDPIVIPEMKTLFRVVGAQISLESRDRSLDCNSPELLEAERNSATVPVGRPFALDAFDEEGNLDREEKVRYTYSVKWEISDVTWASRWDVYMSLGGAKGLAYGGEKEQAVHWLGIVTSAFVTLLIMVICLRLVLKATIGTTQRDIAVMIVGDYEAGGHEANEDSLESWANEIGWKVVSGDVFRKPNMFAYLCVFIGNGMQLLTIVFAISFFGSLGFSHPEYRANTFYTALTAFSFTGGVSGFIGGMMCRIYNQDFEIRAPKFVLYNALGFPLISMAVFIVVDIILFLEKSSAAVSLSTVINLALPWIFFSAPCVFLGAYLAFYKMDPIKLPFGVKPLPREIPRQPWQRRTIVACLVGGYTLWLITSLEVSFIVRSVWTRELYSLFGFLFVTLVLFIVASATIGIVTTYVAISKENWRWWWRSFFTPASVAIFLFIQTLSHAFNVMRSDITMSAISIYALYSLLLCCAIGVMAGAIGTLSSFFFLRRIYSTCRAD
eukprot:GDKJ01037282.1.p1 GENE.GDKJ01037282.1~~GDKJ01037282.1.p1  ORF type:complete len:687 (-),score=112.87 GDKJ01037282.1:30-2090(-)